MGSRGVLFVGAVHNANNDASDHEPGQLFTTQIVRLADTDCDWRRNSVTDEDYLRPSGGLMNSRRVFHCDIYRGAPTVYQFHNLNGTNVVGETIKTGGMRAAEAYRKNPTTLMKLTD